LRAKLEYRTTCIATESNPPAQQHLHENTKYPISNNNKAMDVVDLNGMPNQPAWKIASLAFILYMIFRNLSVAALDKLLHHLVPKVQIHLHEKTGEEQSAKNIHKTHASIN
jgi:hypothetical protein